MFTRIGAAAYKKDLHNTIILLEALGNPHKTFKSIHIAGTNGKGSTSHMLAAVFHKAGYKTGLYTSPHMYDFRERIKISGTDKLEMIPHDFVVNFTEQIKPLIEKIEPSFFEVTVALAFAWFAAQKVDIAIIETGLGGRLDSTNIITPELSIITNIGWDHMNLLGDTLEKIAGEKAGIIKMNISVIIGETLPETLPVFWETAKAKDAPIYFAEKEWEIKKTKSEIEKLEIALKENKSGYELTLECDLPGIYQQYNIRTVVAAWQHLVRQGWNLTETHLKEATLQVKYLTGLGGRWQVISKSPFVVLDVAHNEAGIQVLLDQINNLRQENIFSEVHIITGMVNDKDINKVLQLLPKTYRYYFTQAQMPRALPFKELKDRAATFQLYGDGFQKPNDALAEAKKNATTNDLIIVCGSVFVVAEISITV
jgi:dihydrofolate synthase/folylpolyglutamate synthase